MKLTTARDIALELGVATSTVGRALDNDPRIGAKTKARVREAADRLGYVGNLAAQMMRGVSGKLIGLMIPDVANDFYAAIAQALSRVADERGYRVVLFLTGDDPDVEARQVRELLKIRASGLIMVPTGTPLPHTIEFARSLGVVQLLRHSPALGDNRFGMDDRAALQAAATHLIMCGHRRIAYLGGTPQLSTGAERLAGVRAAFTAAGVMDELLERLGPPTAQFGSAAMAELLEAPRPPTAVLAGSAHITLGVIGTLEARDTAVPGDLSLVGFGNAPWYAWWRGGITAVTPAVADIARDCGLWCIDRIERAVDATADMAVSLPSELVVRRSVARIIRADARFG